MAIILNANVDLDFESENKNMSQTSGLNEKASSYNNLYQYPSNRETQVEIVDLSQETTKNEVKSEEIAASTNEWDYSNYNSFGNKTITNPEELSSEDILAIISMYQDNREVIKEEYERTKKMYEDVRTGSLSWYMKENFWGWLASGLANTPITIDEATTFLQLSSPEEFKNITGYELEDFLKAEQNMLLLEQIIQNIDNNIVSLKYLEVSRKEEFQNFSNSEYYYYTIENSYGEYISQEVFSNLTSEEKKMLKYLETQSPNEAITYLKDMEDIWNQRSAQIRCQKRIDELKNGTIDEKELDTLANMFNVTKDGLSDGINSFFEGLINSITADGKLSIDQYERMLYISYLEENTNYLTDVYKVSNATGNMLPIVTMSMLTQAICPVAAPWIVNGMMGASTYGNVLDETLYEGYNRDIAILYSLSIAGSEILMERFMGGLEVIGKNVSKNFLVNLGKEGVEEALTTILQEGIIDSMVLGREIDLENISEDTVDSFINAIIVAGILNSYTRLTATVLYKGEQIILTNEVLQNIVNQINQGEQPVKILEEMVQKTDPENKENIKPQTDEYLEESANSIQQAGLSFEEIKENLLLKAKTFFDKGLINEKTLGDLTKQIDNLKEDKILKTKEKMINDILGKKGFKTIKDYFNDKNTIISNDTQEKIYDALLNELLQINSTEELTSVLKNDEKTLTKILKNAQNCIENYKMLTKFNSPKLKELLNQLIEKNPEYSFDTVFQESVLKNNPNINLNIEIFTKLNETIQSEKKSVDQTSYTSSDELYALRKAENELNKYYLSAIIPSGMSFNILKSGKYSQLAIEFLNMDKSGTDIGNDTSMITYISQELETKSVTEILEYIDKTMLQKRIPLINNILIELGISADDLNVDIAALAQNMDTSESLIKQKNNIYMQIAQHIYSESNVVDSELLSMMKTIDGEKMPEKLGEYLREIIFQKKENPNITSDDLSKKLQECKESYRRMLDNKIYEIIIEEVKTFGIDRDNLQLMVQEIIENNQGVTYLSEEQIKEQIITYVLKNKENIESAIDYINDKLKKDLGAEYSRNYSATELSRIDSYSQLLFDTINNNQKLNEAIENYEKSNEENKQTALNELVIVQQSICHQLANNIQGISDTENKQYLVEHLLMYNPEAGKDGGCHYESKLMYPYEFVVDNTTPSSDEIRTGKINIDGTAYPKTFYPNSFTVQQIIDYAIEARQFANLEENSIRGNGNYEFTISIDGGTISALVTGDTDTFATIIPKINKKEK